MTKQTPALTGAELIEQLSSEAVRLMHGRDRVANDSSDGAYAYRVHSAGQIQGLRWALCQLKGWNPARESGHGERADVYLRIWHNMPGHCGQPGCGSW